MATVAIGGTGTGGNADLELFNASGALVYRQTVVLDGDQRVMIPRSGAMPAGVYFVVLRMASGMRQEAKLVWRD